MFSSKYLKMAKSFVTFIILSTILVLLEFSSAYGHGYVPCHNGGTKIPRPRSTTATPPESKIRHASDWNHSRDPDGDNIIGVGGLDYPILYSIPRTNFVCANTSGYYADLEASCQVFHVCLETGGYVSFLCPNGTIFNDLYSVCDWWYNVKCVPPNLYAAEESTANNNTSNYVNHNDADHSSTPDVFDVTTEDAVSPLVELQVHEQESVPHSAGFTASFLRRPPFSQAHI